MNIERANVPKYARWVIRGFVTVFPIIAFVIFKIGVRFIRPPITKCRCRVDNFRDNNIIKMDTIKRATIEYHRKLRKGAISLHNGVESSTVSANANTNPFCVYDKEYAISAIRSEFIKNEPTVILALPANN